MPSVWLMSARRKWSVRDLLLPGLTGDILRRLHRLLHFLRELIDAHVVTYEARISSQSVACLPRLPSSNESASLAGPGAPPKRL